MNPHQKNKVDINVSSHSTPIHAEKLRYIPYSPSRPTNNVFSASTASFPTRKISSKTSSKYVKSCLPSFLPSFLLLPPLVLSLVNPSSYSSLTSFTLQPGTQILRLWRLCPLQSRQSFRLWHDQHRHRAPLSRHHPARVPPHPTTHKPWWLRLWRRCGLRLY
jgi:hypothetical protein